MFTLHHGDCRSVMATFADASVDACVTDPPYDLTANKKGGTGAASVNLASPYGRARIGTGNGPGGFMGKKWDGTGIAFDPETWREVLRVLKPGAHLLAFGGTRTYHRMACAIEDAGFEIRDSIHWMYSTGFPKSLNIGDGRGTALKPAHEPIVLARKPLDGTVAANVQAHGTGALNIDACRIAGDEDGSRNRPPSRLGSATTYAQDEWTRNAVVERQDTTGRGRWPANVILSHSPDCDAECVPSCAVAMLDAQSGRLQSGSVTKTYSPTLETSVALGAKRRNLSPDAVYADSGGASRFFYCAKPDRAERDLGCAHLPKRSAGEATDREDGSDGLNSPRAGSGRTGGARNFHPTVKPISLMRYLCRLITPPNGTVLDPFCGSGTTGIAALAERFNFIGIDQSAEYLEIAKARIEGDSPMFNRAIK